MRIYARGPNARKQAKFTQSIAPGADPDGKDGPKEWWDETGNAVTFHITFEHGRAEVSSEIGKFMVAKGYAQKTGLILPS